MASYEDQQREKLKKKLQKLGWRQKTILKNLSKYPNVLPRVDTEKMGETRAATCPLAQYLDSSFEKVYVWGAYITIDGIAVATAATPTRVRRVVKKLDKQAGFGT